MSRYIPQEIEPKWQARWDADGLYNGRRFDQAQVVCPDDAALSIAATCTPVTGTP